MPTLFVPSSCAFDDSPEDERAALLSRWRIFINGVEHTDDIIPTVKVACGGAV